MNATSSSKPSIHIHEANANPTHLAEICAGLEEEGIPAAVYSVTGDVKQLAEEAANGSRLRVGIGITNEYAMLQIRNYTFDIHANDSAQENDTPTLHINLSNNDSNLKCRALGTNAARAVKGGVLV